MSSNSTPNGDAAESVRYVVGGEDPRRNLPAPENLEPGSIAVTEGRAFAVRYRGQGVYWRELRVATSESVHAFQQGFWTLLCLTGLAAVIMVLGIAGVISAGPGWVGGVTTILLLGLLLPAYVDRRPLLRAAGDGTFDRIPADEAFAFPWTKGSKR